MAKLDPAPTEGQQLIAWVGLIYAFGSVEIIERTTDFDVGPNGKGRQQPTWLAVCVDPFYSPYVGSLVVVRQFKSGTVFVLAVDNDDVLWGDPTPDMPTVVRYVFRLTSAKLGNGFIETDDGGTITQGTGEYGDYYVGMMFRQFLTGWEKADPHAKYSRLSVDFITATRLAL